MIGGQPCPRYGWDNHDVRTGNHPDPRLLKFLHHDLPSLIPAARERFDAYKGLLWRYGSGKIDYSEFAWRACKMAADGGHAVTDVSLTMGVAAGVFLT